MTTLASAPHDSDVSRDLLDVIVARRSRETAEVALIELKSATEAALPAFAAGDHVDMHLPGGLIRQYSISNAPGQNDVYRFGVLLTTNSRGGSRAVHALKVGETFRISPPRNAFALQEDAKRSILIGGGIGITPLMAMASRLHDIGADFELNYCARSKLHAAFRKRLIKAPFSKNIRWHFDGSDGRTTFDPMSDLPQPDAATNLYVCGPAGFMKYVRNSAAEAGWADSNVHYEAFEPLVVGPNEKAFELRAERSGLDITVRATQTAAQALDEAGISVYVSCEQGICGTCFASVLEGDPDHRDTYQTDAEKRAGGKFALCCSRAKSDRIVLDI